jgi:hypothetical protein
VKVVGDVAVMTRRNVVTIAADGPAVERSLRFTQVWRRRGTLWRRAFFHATFHATWITAHRQNYMSETLRRVLILIRDGQVLISAHGSDEMAEDGILAAEAVEGAAAAVVVEDYPEFMKGQCTLVLQRDRSGRPIHVDGGFLAVRRHRQSW